MELRITLNIGLNKTKITNFIDYLQSKNSDFEGLKLFMGNRILNRDQEILYLSNSAFEILQRKLEDIIDKGSVNDPVIVDFVERMDQSTYGLGMIDLDISEYFNDSPNSLLLFIEIVNEALAQLIKEELFNLPLREEETNKFLRTLRNHYFQISDT